MYQLLSADSTYFDTISLEYAVTYIKSPSTKTWRKHGNLSAHWSHEYVSTVVKPAARLCEGDSEYFNFVAPEMCFLALGGTNIDVFR